MSAKGHGLVEQLQLEALDKEVPLSTLLRRTKLAAAKLNLVDAIGWVDAELNGYNAEPPEYRHVSGEPVYWNPYHGWQPLAFADSKMGAALSNRWVTEPITSIEDTLKGEGSTLMVHLSSDVLSALNQMADIPITRAAVMVGRGSFVGILEHVRTAVLDWAVSLESAGITGEGISFSREERHKASSAHIHIGSFQGNFNAGELSGPNARFNIHSDDQSTNVVVGDSLFEQVENALVSGISNMTVRQKIVGDLQTLRDANSQKDRLSAYQRLIETAANHMTLLAPFLPALTAYIGR